MAIDAGDLFLLIEEAKARPFTGAILTFGRQDVTVGGPALTALALRQGFAVRDAVSAGPARLTDVALFRALGFSDVHSLDVNGYEGASVLHDLNSPDVPASAAGRYDVVFDRGTSEHVFHTPNMFSAAGRLARVGGRVMHLSPSTNHMDHGFYMFAPRLFHAFYAANGFEIERLALVRYPWLDRRPRIEVYAFDPSAPCTAPGGRLDDAGYQVFCVARKRADSTVDRVPRWRDGPAASASVSAARGDRPALRRVARIEL